jgi:hypothetical protein
MPVLKKYNLSKGGKIDRNAILKLKERIHGFIELQNKNTLLEYNNIITKYNNIQKL